MESPRSALLAGTAGCSNAKEAEKTAAANASKGPTASGADSPDASGPEVEKLQNMLTNAHNPPGGGSLTAATLSHLADLARWGAGDGRFEPARVPQGQQVTIEVVCMGKGAVNATAVSGTVKQMEDDDDFIFTPLAGGRVAGEKVPCTADPKVQKFQATVEAPEVSVRVVPETGSTGVAAWDIVRP